jgi:hypothetical protein
MAIPCMAIVADDRNNCIRKISPDGSVSALAGSGEEGFGEGQRAQAILCSPSGQLAVDGNGNIIIADEDNHCIRKISLEGNVSTRAGAARRVWRRTRSAGVAWRLTGMARSSSRMGATTAFKRSARTTPAL